jgi:HEPN domain
LSKLIETRTEFQALADERLEEANALLGLGKWSGAYYLAGYTVELALKACIIKMLMATDAFPEKDFSKHCYTHALVKLVELAKLGAARQAAIDADQHLFANWTTVRDWSEEKRYWQIDQADAEALWNAVTEPNHGVLPWIKIFW